MVLIQPNGSSIRYTIADSIIATGSSTSQHAHISKAVHGPDHALSGSTITATRTNLPILHHPATSSMPLAKYTFFKMVPNPMPWLIIRAVHNAERNCSPSNRGSWQLADTAPISQHPHRARGRALLFRKKCYMIATLSRRSLPLDSKRERVPQSLPKTYTFIMSSSTKRSTHNQVLAPFLAKRHSVLTMPYSVHQTATSSTMDQTVTRFVVLDLVLRQFLSCLSYLTSEQNQPASGYVTHPSHTVIKPLLNGTLLPLSPPWSLQHT